MVASISAARVRRAEEGGFKLRRRQPDACIQHSAMEAAKEFGVAGRGRLPVEDRVIGEKPGEHAADLVGGDRDSGVARGLR